MSVSLSDDGFIVSEGWMGDIKNVYDQRYYPDTDFKDVSEIISKIRKGDFKSGNYIKKCENCQYKYTCDKSIVKKALDNINPDYRHFFG